MAAAPAAVAVAAAAALLCTGRPPPTGLLALSPPGPPRPPACLSPQESGAAKELLTPIQRVWAIMPLMHSEALGDQEQCVERFRELAAECEAEDPGGAMAKMAGMNHKYAVAHLDVVKQWGRFPHRNAILGRPSTPEEAAGLAAGTIAKF